mmetsp:Transcript_12866/g.21762  ORF Transcript_12866/g.21762 Transcript_12866/m.21762 type:complete len:205 (-) Transcript_12866:111-725(-)
MVKMGAYPKMHPGDFAFFFADIFVESVQYGNRTDLCNFLDTIADADLDTQLSALKTWSQKVNVGPSDYCRHNIKNVSLSNVAARSWTYQYCSEFGWFQTPSQEHPMRPASLLNITYWNDYCHDIFGVNLKINRTLGEFSFHHTAGSQTIFTNGGEDPWQWATELKPESKLNQTGFLSDCADCGHCGDLYTPSDSDPKELVETRE